MGSTLVNTFQCGVPPPNLLSEGVTGTDLSIPWISPIERRVEGIVDSDFAALMVSPSLLLFTVYYFVADWRFETKISDMDKVKLRIYSMSAYKTFPGSNVLSGTQRRRPFRLTHFRLHPEYRPGPWQSRRNAWVLAHIEENVDPKLASPICLPNPEEEMLEDVPSDFVDSSLLLFGWTRGNKESITTLRLNVAQKRECFEFWKGNPSTRSYKYENLWCAKVGTGNQHTQCINSDVVAAKNVSGKFYYGGIASQLYSLNGSRICYPGSKYFFMKSTNRTLNWIRDNIKCGSRNFTCSDGTCVNLKALCNGTFECSDGSDEDREYCSSIKLDELDSLQIILWVLLALLIIAVLFFPYIARRSKKKIITRSNEVPLDVYNQYDKMNLSWDSEYDIPYRWLKISNKLLGEGRFGKVWEGILTKEPNAPLNVAVKTPVLEGSTEAERKKEFELFETEIRVLSYVGAHPNIAHFHGACTEEMENLKLYIITELYTKGSLDDYLRNNRNRFLNLENKRERRRKLILRRPLSPGYISPIQFDTLTLMKWSAQVSSGMVYLSSKSIVHCDLSAKNVLLSNCLEAKIADFGLAKVCTSSGYFKKSGHEPVPWRWMAPEALTSRRMSENSDVWSMGILLWEIFSLGEVPFADQGDRSKFVEALRNGDLMLAKPEFCNREMWTLMKSTWNLQAENRPTFAEISETLQPIVAKYASLSPTNADVFIQDKKNCLIA